MSAHQMVCHLADGFRMVLGQKSVDPDNSFFTRTLLKWVALYGPLPWPPGILTRPELDQLAGGTRPVAFAADVAELETLMDRFTADPAQLDCRSHPFFGTMSTAAWLRWGYLHMNHHLRQFGA
jgi:hypothetical protein